MTSAETRKLLRAALGLEDEKPNRIRSHSLKVTALGWAAKGGMDLPSRHILGHHLDPGAKAAEIYGRDSISSAIRKLCGLLALIKQGRFSPDSSRSGRFTNAHDQKAQSEEDPSDDGSNQGKNLKHGTPHETLENLSTCRSKPIKSNCIYRLGRLSAIIIPFHHLLFSFLFSFYFFTPPHPSPPSKTIQVPTHAWIPDAGIDEHQVSLNSKNRFCSKSRADSKTACLPKFWGLSFKTSLSTRTA